jgi:ClpX C4-type zinc finger protein/sigma-70-like protein
VAEREFHCSFCAGAASTVGRLVAGPGVTICQACVDLCQQILATPPDEGVGAPLFPIDFPLDDPEEAIRDLRLVSFHLQGDTDAFFVITDQHSTGLLEEATQLLGSSQDADDAVHETFLRATRAIRRFDRYGQWHLRPWLGAILRQVSIERRMA